jgi:hypothetical protein
LYKSSELFHAGIELSIYITLESYVKLATKIKLARETIMAVAIAHDTIEFNSNGEDWTAHTERQA